MQLLQERDALQRWQKRLRRAFHAVEKSNSRMERLERQIHKRENP